MTDRELMQQALDYLDAPSSKVWAAGTQYKIIQALRARLAQPEQEIEPDRPHVEDDGCPTEKAVLQRFWREHQKQEPVRLQCVICGTVYADGVPPQVAQPKQKLWLWKNFVDGRPEYWAFDNPYPTNLDNGDPQTLGQPCGYAIFKPSRDGSCGRTEEQVLREMKSVSTPPQRKWQYRRGDRLLCLETEEYCVIHVAGTNRQWIKFPDSHVGVYTNEQVAEMFELLPREREWQGLMDEEIIKLQHLIDWTAHWSTKKFARAIEAKLKEKNA